MTLSSGRRLGALAVTAAALSFAAPSVASAATTANIEADNTITLTGDATGDRLTIESNAAGELTYNGAVRDFDSDQADIQAIALADIGDRALRIATGDGNDVVTFSGGALSAFRDNKVTIDGGDGDDTLFGTNVADQLLGGAGNDLLTPGQNAVGTVETMDGGAGNDTLFWHEGEGSDVADGGAGADTVEVNGAKDLSDVFTLVKNGDRAKFDRTNRGNFTIDSVANERFEINGIGGDDDVTLGDGLAAQPGPVLVTVDGGSGADTLRGGNGADLIRGGDGNDNLAGGGGDDEIIGDRGDDRMSGGAGDDKLVWNNGDGTDDTIGDDGYDVTEVNGFAAAETYVVKPQNGIARLDRTLTGGAAVGLFGMNMATEALELNTFGGDDDLTIQDGTPITERIDGGSGNDTLRGADGDDTLFGGGGNDTLVGNGGYDVLDGSVGDDAINARDNVPDMVRCASGNDSAVLDAAGIDAQNNCETIDQTPGGGANKVGRLSLTSKSASAKIKGSKYTMTVKVSCPAGGAGCNGTLVLNAANGSKSGARISARLTSKSYRVAAGKTANIKLTFSRKTRAFARKGAIAATATTQARSVGGITAVKTSKLKIKLPPKKR